MKKSVRRKAPQANKPVEAESKTVYRQVEFDEVEAGDQVKIGLTEPEVRRRTNKREVRVRGSERMMNIVELDGVPGKVVKKTETGIHMQYLVDEPGRDLKGLANVPLPRQDIQSIHKLAEK